MLRLEVPAALTRPIWVDVGQNGPAGLIVYAKNVGDGILAPQADGGFAPWLAPVVESALPCPSDAQDVCHPVRIVLNTASLAAGTYEGTVTVSSAGAVDSPQSVNVKVYVGGNVPTQVDFYLPPRAGSSEFLDFQTPEGPAPKLTAAGQFLSVTSSNLGSYRVLHTHRLMAGINSGTPTVGNYAGSLTVSGSTYAPDNRVVPVNVHITDGPILQLSSTKLSLTTVPGVTPYPGDVVVSNRGSGELTVSQIAVATETGGDWLKSTFVTPTILRNEIQAGALTPGLHHGTVDLTSNAANSPTRLHVWLTVDAAGSPISFFHGVVNGATFSSNTAIAPGTLVSLFGEQLAQETAFAQSVPLSAELGGASVTIDGRAAPMLFASYGQLNFQVPWEVGLGDNKLVRVTRGGQAGNQISVKVESRSPGLFVMRSPNYGAVRNATKGNFPLPVSYGGPGFPTAPARPGDYLEIFGTGLGPVSPATTTGAAAGANPLSTLQGGYPIVNFGRTSFGPLAEPLFVGLTPGFVGLFQINVQIPENTVTNERTWITLQYPGGGQSNTIEIAVER